MLPAFLKYDSSDYLFSQRRKVLKKQLAVIILSVFFVLFVFLTGCQREKVFNDKKPGKTEAQKEPQSSQISLVSKKVEEKKLLNKEKKTEQQTEELLFIHPEGSTLESRIAVPEGYYRVKAKKDDFLHFLRSYKMKKDKSPVLMHDKKAKVNQKAHIAVFDMDVEKGDLQQCADSIMRIYAEYFRSVGKDEKISFHFVSGFKADYSKWKKGFRIQVKGNKVNWVKQTGEDSSDQSFRKYLRMVFSYAGTMSMEKETRPVKISEIKAGDVFLKGGSPGHVVMIADICENREGKKAFLLAQGYMPAQDFHILKNPQHRSNPWYYEDELSYPLITPEYQFNEGSLKRLCYDDEKSK